VAVTFPWEHRAGLWIEIEGFYPHPPSWVRLTRPTVATSTHTFFFRVHSGLFAQSPSFDDECQLVNPAKTTSVLPASQVAKIAAAAFLSCSALGHFTDSVCFKAIGSPHQ
jgi:hypothetical protein